jgi:hypothetical protein
VRDTAGGCGDGGVCGGSDTAPKSNLAPGCGGSGHPIFLDADARAQSRKQYLDPVEPVGEFRQDRGGQLLLEEGLRPHTPLKLAEGGLGARGRLAPEAALFI